MPPLISAAEFRERFDIKSDIRDQRIVPHIGSASRRLRKWVGETVYAQAVDVAGNEDADLDLVNDLKNAEAHLAFHFAIYGLNSPVSIKGVVATAVAGAGKELHKYLTPDETAKLAEYFLELAREIAEPYMLTDEASAFETVGITDDAEASTRNYGPRCC